MSCVRKIDVLITSFARPKLLEGLLQTLSQQNANYDAAFEVRYHLFQDSVIDINGNLLADNSLVDANISLFNHYMPNQKVFLPETNLGIIGNTEREFKFMGQSDADFFFMFEEDLILSPYYISTITNLMEQASANPLIGLVNGTGSEPPASLSAQRENAQSLVPMGHKWAMSFSRAIFLKLSPFMDSYFAACKETDYKSTGHDDLSHAKTKGAADFFYRFGWPTRTMPPFTPDQALNLFNYIYSMYNISTFINLAKYVGAVGAHSTEEIYNNMELDKAVLYDGKIPESFCIPSVDETIKNVQNFNFSIANAKIREEQLISMENVVKSSISHNKLNLNLGSGSYIINDWINLDKNLEIKISSASDILLRHENINDIPFANASVDYIYSFHFMDKLTSDEGMRVIRECRRVLKNGGIFRVVVSDTETALKAYSDNNNDYFENLRNKISDYLPSDDTISPIDFITRNANAWGHKTLFDSRKITKMLMAAGFNNVREVAYDYMIDPADPVLKSVSICVEAQ